jgi:hypothetical protein
VPASCGRRSVRKRRCGRWSNNGVPARSITQIDHPDRSHCSRQNERGPAGFPAGPLVLCFVLNVGGDLLSHTLASAVPSALEGLASGFGMGPGVPPPPTPPTTLFTNHPPPTRRQRPDGAGGLNTPPPPPRPRKTRGPGRNMVVCSGSHSGCEQHACRQALGLLVPVNSTPHRASIPGLSTPSSLGGLNHAPSSRTRVVGDLILERASRLDAFSGYPFRT